MAKPYKYKDYDDDQYLSSHGSFYAIKKISELLIGADKYAMLCNQRKLNSLPIYQALGMWYNVLKRVFINSKTLLSGDKNENEGINALFEEFEFYFSELNKPPSARSIQYSDSEFESRCIMVLDELQTEITLKLQDVYQFFFRMGTMEVKRGAPKSNEDLLHELKKRGFDVGKIADKHNKPYKK